MVGVSDAGGGIAEWMNDGNESVNSENNNMMYGHTVEEVRDRPESVVEILIKCFINRNLISDVNTDDHWKSHKREQNVNNTQTEYTIVWNSQHAAVNFEC